MNQLPTQPPSIDFVQHCDAHGDYLFTCAGCVQDTVQSAVKQVENYRQAVEYLGAKLQEDVNSLIGWVQGLSK